jgi:crotonyl-CoA carboxylase/reductase
MSDSYPIGSMPPTGEVPNKMFAQVVRQDRFGDPRQAFQTEEIDVPELKPYEVLIGVMAAGLSRLFPRMIAVNTAKNWAL